VAPSRLVAVSLVLLLGTGLSLSLPAGVDAARALVDEREERRPACPDLSIAIRPYEIHFTPGLTEHESWLDFAVPPRFAGRYALCFDGRQVDAGPGLVHLPGAAATARLGIHTRLVDLHWLDHTLEGLAEPSHWELRLDCDASTSCS
jgi:hypothetical protein